VELTDTTREAGDEPLQMKRKFPNATVAVDIDRVQGINKLMKEIDGLGAVILDDAFQYRKVQPALSLLMIDYNRPIQKDYLLPLGRLRDYAYQHRRSDVVFFTKCPKQLKPIERGLKEKDMHIYPYQQLYFTTFEYGKHCPVFQAKEIDATEAIAITGIANPKPFLEQLGKKYTLKKHLKYPDHHRFSVNDARTINAVARQYPKASIFTTEKDALRLHETKGLDEQVQQRLFYIPIEVIFLSEKEKDKFVKYVVDFVRKNRRNNILHSIL
jgi:tetraacyldisaccharide 4'-kinase